MTMVQASSAGKKTELQSNSAIDMAKYRITVAVFYCSYVCCSGHSCFACFVDLLLCAAVCSVAVSFRSIVTTKWLVHPRPQSAEISADCGDFGCPRDNTSYTLDTCSDDLKKLHMAQKTRFERAAKYEPYIAAFDYPDA